MVSFDTNLNNFSYCEILLAIFGEYSTDFVYTATGIFRRTVPPVCPECCMQMNYNGYNTYEKRCLGSVKIGDISALLVIKPVKKSVDPGKS